MKRLYARAALVAILASINCGAVHAQQSAEQQNQAKVDDPAEWPKFKESCLDFQIKTVPSCAELLFTGKPLHIAVGSLSPQNGFGAGAAYVGFLTPTEMWRPSWNADAVATGNGSWRAGVYFKFVHTPAFRTTVHYGKPKIKSNLTELPEHTVFNAYVQAISLNKLSFFGLGPLTTEAGRSFFGMREVIPGVSGVKPVLARWNVALTGEVNGRLVSLRPSSGNGSPSIENLYTEATAPGLTAQPGFLQLGEGIRLRPVFWNDIVHLNYNIAYQQFIAPGDSHFTFQRVNVDLGHDFALYHATTRFGTARDANGPDECSIEQSGGVTRCGLVKQEQVANCIAENRNDPARCKAISRDLQGSVSFRVFYSTSVTGNGSVVPFYFQPTLGGGDVNGNPSLGSYQDYRFRAPNVLLLRQRFEHTLYGPMGLALMADEGKVALERGDFGASTWLRSYSAGLTLRAGGFPQVFLLFSWGGNEGTHTIANVNASLLGGSARPSLF
ncbi:MAG TPA: hypothetical protein VFI38_08520 [Candidatus Acidoferrum sp.]|nr:hypothetical protein [Candidatus Acidoferrum sp.]